MGEDATLEAFLEADEQSGTTAVEDGAECGADQGEETEASTGRPGAPAVEPATTTFAFAPSGESCDECGDTVERRWQQDGALVCADCKDW